jgi:hypothetical protein
MMFAGPSCYSSRQPSARLPLPCAPSRRAQMRDILKIVPNDDRPRDVLDAVSRARYVRAPRLPAAVSAPVPSVCYRRCSHCAATRQRWRIHTRHSARNASQQTALPPAAQSLHCPPLAGIHVDPKSLHAAVLRLARVVTRWSPGRSQDDSLQPGLVRTPSMGDEITAGRGRAEAVGGGTGRAPDSSRPAMLRSSSTGDGAATAPKPKLARKFSFMGMGKSKK